MADPPGIDRLTAFTNREELRELRSLIPPEERVLYALDGEAQGRKGLLAATDRRVVFLLSGMFRQRLWAFPYRDIQRLEVRLDREQGVLEIASRRGAFVVVGLDRRLAPEFAEAADRAAKEGPRTFQPVEPVAPPAPEQRAREGTPERAAEERIERIERMRARGSMTELEAQAALRRVLEATPLPAAYVAAAIRRAHAAAPAEHEAAPKPSTYEWSQGQGMTTRAPVTTDEDPMRALRGAARPKDAAHGRLEVAARPIGAAAGAGDRAAGARAEVADERPTVAPPRSAAKPAVAAESTAAQVQPVRSASRGPTELPDERPSVVPPRSAARRSIEVEGPLVDLGDGDGQSAPEGKAAGDADRGRKPGKPSIWPPLPE